MEVQLGAAVRTAEGRDAGSVDKLIVDPSNGRVRAIVVRKGRLFPDDVEVPVGMLRPGEGSQVLLDCPAERFKDLPRFREAEYTELPPEMPPPVGYAAEGVLWPVGYGVYPDAGLPIPPTAGEGFDRGYDQATRAEIDTIQREHALSNAVVDEGSDVYSREGEKVGEVHSLSFDTGTREPTELVVRQGFLFKHDFSLPASAIDSVDDDRVTLNLTREEIEQHVRTRA